MNFWRGLFFASVAGVAFGLALMLAGHVAQAANATPDLLSRGRYLTGGAGQCADCHRPGLGGGPNLAKARPGIPWAKNVPSLRGLPMFPSDADAVAFLRTAKLRNGMQARRPMPHYHFAADDAAAIVAYLRSLK